MHLSIKINSNISDKNNKKYFFDLNMISKTFYILSTFTITKDIYAELWYVTQTNIQNNVRDQQQVT